MQPWMLQLAAFIVIGLAVYAGVRVFVPNNWRHAKTEGEDEAGKEHLIEQV